MYQRIEFACAFLLLVAIVVLVGVAAVARAAGAPIIWSVEIAQLMFVWLCMLAADLALQQERHFGMMVLLDNVPEKIRRAVEIANTLIIMGLLIFLLNYAWRNMILMHPRLLGAIQMHGSYLHASIVIGLLLMLRTAVVQAFNRIRSRG